MTAHHAYHSYLHPLTICAMGDKHSWALSIDIRNILGPFPQISGQRKFLLVAMDYFTKWVEAKPLALIAEARIVDFIWKSIICRIGLPWVLIIDNRCQFTRAKFKKFCKEHGIAHHLTSVVRPQANGEVEVTNHTILWGLKIRLDKDKRSWIDELYHILWIYRTMPRVSIEKTSFNLAFGIEAVIPIEVGVSSATIENFDE